ncbi:hypothetical protein ES703_54700 [subsurface metagenome]
MPSRNTFDILPIFNFVQKHLLSSEISVDPFARDKRWATYTNDLNPKTKAEYHLDVLDFLKILIAKKIQADLILFDPPYSLRQIKECYEGIGRKYTSNDGWKPNRWKEEKDLIDRILLPGSIVLSFGWSSNGMGKKRHYEILEILLVCHGAGHNDTICLAEKKIKSKQIELF